MLLNVTDAWNMDLMEKMLMQDETDMRFDYQKRVPIVKPWFNGVVKGKLPQTNSQSKQAIVGSGNDKIEPKQFLTWITKREIIPMLSYF